MKTIKRGELWWASFNPVRGSEQGGVRPCVIIQNNKGNELSRTTIVTLITSKLFDKEYPLNIKITDKKSGLKKDSTILCNQIRTIDKARLIKRIGYLDPETTKKLDKAIKISLDLN